MTIKDQVKNYLEKQPLARERKNKDRALVNLLLQKYHGSINEIPKEVLVDIVRDYNSMDRAWRQTLEHNPSLRGKDYDEKESLMQAKQVELGYGDQRRLPV